MSFLGKSFHRKVGPKKSGILFFGWGRQTWWCVGITPSSMLRAHYCWCLGMGCWGLNLFWLQVVLARYLQGKYPAYSNISLVQRTILIVWEQITKLACTVSPLAPIIFWSQIFFVSLICALVYCSLTRKIFP